MPPYALPPHRLPGQPPGSRIAVQTGEAEKLPGTEAGEPQVIDTGEDPVETGLLEMGTEEPLLMVPETPARVGATATTT